jgi:hypothetical protein
VMAGMLTVTLVELMRECTVIVLKLFCLLPINSDFYVLFKQYEQTPVVTCKSVARLPYLSTFVHIFRNKLCSKVRDCLYMLIFFFPVKLFKGSLVINRLYTIFT